MKKIQISINEDLLDRADVYADDNYMSRSGLITLALNQYLLSNEMARNIKSLSASFNKIAETGSISDEDRKVLEDFERFARLIPSK